MSNNILSSGTGAHVQLDRVQSANYNFSVTRQDINQYGELARIDSIVLEPPTVNLDFTYYLTDGTNERALGFYVLTGNLSVSNPSGNFASGHMTPTSGKNFFIVTTSEGVDHNYNGAIINEKSMIGIGNGFLSDYTLDVSVGSIPTVSVTIEGANVLSTGITQSAATGILGANPGIRPDDGYSYAASSIYLPSGQTNLGNAGVTALRPGDVTLSFGGIATNGSGVISDIGGTSDSFHIQSASLSVPLSRSAIQRLGTKFPFARPVDFPVTSTLTVNAILNEVTAENLAAVLETDVKTDITLAIKKPGTTQNAVIYVLKGAKLDSENFTSSIGSNKTVDLTFSTQVGGPQDLSNGVFVSGVGTTPLFVGP